MNREKILTKLRSPQIWDLLIVGGGATGLGTAVEAVSRGLRTLLIEQSDFCKGTSSKSTKLIHGGVRYLQQGNLRLVSDALNERRNLLRNAPHLVHPVRFLIPAFKTWELAYYGIGLKLYDLLARDKGIEKSGYRSAESIREAIPTLGNRKLSGGIQYCDALFDDAKLGISLAKTASDQGALLLNYSRLISFTKSEGRISGGIIRDQFSNQELELRARVVVNATGPFSDLLRRLDDPQQDRLVSASRGSHIVLDKKFLPGSEALLIPRTNDGRVLFAIPWMGRVLCGTTDVEVNDVNLEPRPSREDILFMLEHLGQYLNQTPKKNDILSVFAGFRPLVRNQNRVGTAAISRDHNIEMSKSGLVTIIGGKWTTYRRMAQDLVDFIGNRCSLNVKPSISSNMPLYGSPSYSVRNKESAPEEDQIQSVNPQEKLVDFTNDTFQDVVNSVRHEWACTVEDVLARRTRILFLDVRKAVELAPIIAGILAKELGRDKHWETEQIQSFNRLAERYLP